MEVNLTVIRLRPTEEMLSYMMEATVGDDVFKEDPTINALEEKVAKLFGKRLHSFSLREQWPIKQLLNCIQPGDQLICDHYAHIFNYEGWR